MNDIKFIKLAKEKVNEHYLKNKLEESRFAVACPFVVWQVKVLQNYKALLGVSDPNDQHYYEVTYNGDKGELYLDVYNKEENICIKVNEDE
ncbi:DUF6275 family protein [Limosilactobacillus reuteri]|uniref:DUF6275 family protein n=1 Tax=Limosilactobacillus reuteri TaxID=1598 RepID=UPI001C5BD61D|nr:DUF6275 family protein [Limosilactobacillus reuteri]MBW3350641.1 hypothetical protein [Limosilactobacillus reuteri]UUW69684.1 DUF6275 family protein [Limosilactobacillus reuteri]